MLGCLCTTGGKRVEKKRKERTDERRVHPEPPHVTVNRKSPKMSQKSRAENLSLQLWGIIAKQNRAIAMADDSKAKGKTVQREKHGVPERDCEVKDHACGRDSHQSKKEYFGSCWHSVEARSRASTEQEVQHV